MIILVCLKCILPRHMLIKCENYVENVVLLKCFWFILVRTVLFSLIPSFPLSPMYIFFISLCSPSLSSFFPFLCMSSRQGMVHFVMLIGVHAVLVGDRYPVTCLPGSLSSYRSSVPVWTYEAFTGRSLPFPCTAGNVVSGIWGVFALSNIKSDL